MPVGLKKVPVTHHSPLRASSQQHVLVRSFLAIQSQSERSGRGARYIPGTTERSGIDSTISVANSDPFETPDDGFSVNMDDYGGLDDALAG